MVRLGIVAGALPGGFDVLRAAAETEGHRHMARLEADWASGAQRFDAPGEILLAAWLDEALVGVGGRTREPAASDAGILRLRRVYVLPSARGRGVAKALVTSLVEGAQAPLITVNAGGGSDGFWEALRFRRVHGQPWTHECYSAA